jgi:hypothetical protein
MADSRFCPEQKEEARMKKWLCLVLVLSAGPLVAVEPVKSGPQVGEKVPGPFRPLNINGPRPGAPNCLYCANGANPVVMIFAREDSPALRCLIRQLDAATASDEEARLGTCAIYLTNDAATVGATLKAFVEKENIKHTILATMAADQPARYGIAADGAVTVLLYRHFTVKANHAFRAGELTDAGASAVMADLPKILAAE